jgi:hypothetical protein
VVASVRWPSFLRHCFWLNLRATFITISTHISSVAHTTPTTDARVTRRAHDNTQGAPQVSVKE